jgi:hypothetical protein
MRPQERRETRDEGRGPTSFLLSTLDPRLSTSRSGKNFPAPFSGNSLERLPLKFLFKIIRFHFAGMVFNAETRRTPRFAEKIRSKPLCASLRPPRLCVKKILCRVFVAAIKII